MPVANRSDGLIKLIPFSSSPPIFFQSSGTLGTRKVSGESNKIYSACKNLNIC